MLVNQACRYELKPNIAQRILLAKHAGTSRHVYNWGLEICQLCLDLGRPIPSAMELHRLWNQWKKAEAPWWEEVSKCSPQEALRDLERALKNFRQGRKEGRYIGFPKFKKKGRSRDSSRFTGAIHLFEKYVQLPRLGKLRLKEDTHKFQGEILSATISRQADRAISDMGWGEFRRQLEYKTKWYGSYLVVASRFYPSSKTCSCCEHKLESLSLAQRSFKGPSCGLVLDRDHNAALNLMKIGLEQVAGSSPETQNARQGGSGLGRPDAAGIFYRRDNCL